MTRRDTLGALSASILLSGCSSLLGTTARLRYRITITCNTPDGVKSGSAVQEIMRFDTITAIQPVNLGTTNLVGDAIVFEVGGRKYFFGLTQCQSRMIDAIGLGNVQPRSAKSGDNIAEMLRAFKANKGRAELSSDAYDKIGRHGVSLASFDDPANFETIRRDRNMTKSSGWSIKNIIVVVSDEKITRQAQNILPWLTTISQDTVKKSVANDGKFITHFKNLSSQFGEA